MSETQILTLTEREWGGLPVRTFVIDGELWFVAADVGRVLRMTNIRASLASLEWDEKGVNTIDTPGGSQEFTTINESGFYSLVMRSRRPESLPFRRWVTREVLPEIRKTGQYALPNPKRHSDLSHEELFDHYVQTVRRLGDVIAEEASAFKIVQAQKDALQVENARVAAWSDYDGLKHVGTVAKELKSLDLFIGGRDKLFHKLASERWIYRNHSKRRWEAYQSHIDNGYLKMRHGTHPQGARMVEHSTVMFTGKGVYALRRLLDPAIPKSLTLDALGSHPVI